MAQGVGSVVSNMGISKRLWLAFGLLLVLLAAQVGAGMLSIRMLNGSVDAMVASSDLATFAKDLEARLANQRIQGRDFLFTGDPKALDRQRALKADFDKVMADHQAAIKASAHAAKFDELSRLHADYHAQFENLRVLRERYDAALRQRMDPLGAKITETL